MSPPSDAPAPAAKCDEALLALLRCPQTQQPLSIAPPTLLAGRADSDGRPLQAALLRADGAVLYPIRDGIPVLLPEAALPIQATVFMS